MGLELIDKLKKEKGWTSEELASISGVPVGTLNKIIQGDTKSPTLETVFALAHALGCSADDFDDDPKAIKKDSSYIELSDDEKILITKWAELTTRNRLKIMGMIDIKIMDQKE